MWCGKQMAHQKEIECIRGVIYFCSMIQARSAAKARFLEGSISQETCYSKHDPYLSGLDRKFSIWSTSNHFDSLVRISSLHLHCQHLWFAHLRSSWNRCGWTLSDRWGCFWSQLWCTLWWFWIDLDELVFGSPKKYVQLPWWWIFPIEVRCTILLRIPKEQ